MLKKFIFFSFVIVLSACNFLTPIPEPDLLDLADFDYYAFVSQDILSDNITNVVASRATVNVTGNVGGFEDGIVNDYPEVGQTTSYTIVDIGGDIYHITATTTYPSGSSVNRTIEEYRVWDMDTNGVWDENDPVVNNLGAIDTKYRFNFKTYLNDFTTREEVIDLDKSTDGVNYTLFDDFTDFTFPSDETELNELVDTMRWSSRVSYFMPIPFWSNSNLWKTWNTKKLIGLRYYSEIINGDGDLVQSYLILEKIVNGNVDISDAIPANIFNDSGMNELSHHIIKVNIIDGVKEIEGVYYIYKSNRLRSTQRVGDEITIEVVD